MKQFGKILNFELMNYLKNKAFVGVTLLLVAIIAVAMFFPRITSLFESGDPGDSTADLPVLLVRRKILLRQKWCTKPLQLHLWITMYR